MLVGTPSAVLAASVGNPPADSGARALVPRETLRVTARSAAPDVRPMLEGAASSAARGDTARAWELLHAAHQSDPANTEARVQIRALDGQPGFQLPIDERALESLRTLLGPQFREVRTEHFLLLSNAPHDWTMRRGQLLQRARHQFFRSLDRLGMPPVPHRHRLVAILFATQEQYAAFARRTLGPSSEWVAAYYDGSLNAIVMFDDQAAPWSGAAHDDAGDQSSAEPSDRPRARARPLARALASAADATTLHEAAHLLSFNCGVQDRGVDYPLWVSEGLATAFETDRPDLPFGPGRGSSPRREAIDTEELSALAPIAALVPARTAPDSPRQASEFYARSWALFDLLASRRPRELAAYLHALRNAPRGPIAPEAHLALFESHFGPLEDVARALERHLGRE